MIFFLQIVAVTIVDGIVIPLFIKGILEYFNGLKDNIDKINGIKNDIRDLNSRMANIEHNILNQLDQNNQDVKDIRALLVSKETNHFLR